MLSLGINPEIGKVDPYAMALSAVDEAMRNAVAVGADPDHIALLDNFCWGSPRRPSRWARWRGQRRAATMLPLPTARPFISGKDSLNNEYVGPDGERVPIPGTLLISALGIIPDVRQAVTMDLKQAGNIVFLIGETRTRWPAATSRWSSAPWPSRLHHHPSRRLRRKTRQRRLGPAPGLPAQGLERYRALHQAMRQGLVRACHDLSEGGLAVAAAEMCIAGRLGLIAAACTSGDSVVQLFSESNGRFLVEVAPQHAEAFRAVMDGCPLAELGQAGGQSLRICGQDGIERA